MLDEHHVNVPLHFVRQEVEVTVGFHADLHSPHHAVQGDVLVDGDHLGSKPAEGQIKEYPG